MIGKNLNQEGFGMKYKILLNPMIPVLFLGMIFILSSSPMFFSEGGAMMTTNIHIRERDAIQKENRADPAKSASLIILEGTGIKGENVTISGMLLDGETRGISNRSVELYWKKKSDVPLGFPIGLAETDDEGNFIFDNYRVPKTQAVGQAFVVGIFQGDDIYDRVESGDVQYSISAYIHVSIDPIILNSTSFFRGETFRMNGEVVETFQGEETDPKIYAKDVKFSVFLTGDGWNRKLDDIVTTDFGQYDTIFMIPPDLEVGGYTLETRFNETEMYQIHDKHLDSRCIKVTADTYIEILDEPEDVTGDGFADVGYIRGYEETGYRFNILLLEKNTLLNESVPVPNRTVTLTITLWDDKGGRYINSTSMVTNGMGRAYFNFTGFFSNEGIQIKEPRLGASGKALIEFKGSTYLKESDEERDLNYLARARIFHQHDPDGDPSATVIIFGFGSVIYLIIAILIGKYVK